MLPAVAWRQKLLCSHEISDELNSISSLSHYCLAAQFYPSCHAVWIFVNIGLFPAPGSCQSPARPEVPPAPPWWESLDETSQLQGLPLSPRLHLPPWRSSHCPVGDVWPAACCVAVTGVSPLSADNLQWNVTKHTAARPGQPLLR